MAVKKENGAENNKQPVVKYEVERERTFLKLMALFGMYDQVVKLDIALPVVPEAEQIGLRLLYEDALADLELLMYGECNWMKWLDHRKVEE